MGFRATGVGPGMTHSLCLNWGIPSSDPVKTTLLSHCEKEFQVFLSSGVSGSTLTSLLVRILRVMPNKYYYSSSGSLLIKLISL